MIKVLSNACSLSDSLVMNFNFCSHNLKNQMLLRLGTQAIELLLQFMLHILQLSGIEENINNNYTLQQRN